MSMHDPLADMFTRIRNAQMAGHPEVSLPATKLKASIAKVLSEEGYIDGFVVDDDEKKPTMTVRLKYFEGRPVIQKLQRYSKSSRRQYAGKDGLPSVANGLGVAIVSTPKGVISDRQARREGVGGEIICTVF